MSARTTVNITARSRKGDKMKTRSTHFLDSVVFLTVLLPLLITVSLMFSGCVTAQASIDNSKDKQDYVYRAMNAIEKYRVTNHNEFYGFMLGEIFEGRNSSKFFQDEQTGGHLYKLKDSKGVFDAVVINTDQIGKILKITEVHFKVSRTRFTPKIAIKIMGY